MQSDDVNHVVNLSTYLVQIKVVDAPINLNLLHFCGIFVSVTLIQLICYASWESQRNASLIEARYSHDYYLTVENSRCPHFAPSQLSDLTSSFHLVHEQSSIMILKSLKANQCVFLSALETASGSNKYIYLVLRQRNVVNIVLFMVLNYDCGCVTISQKNLYIMKKYD